MFLLMFVCSQRGGGLSLEGSVPRPKSEKWAVRILLECFLLGYSVDVKVKFPFRPSVSPTVIYSGFRRNSKWPYKASSTTVKHASGADQELPVLNNSGTFTLRSLHWATTSVSSSWRLMTWLILGWATIFSNVFAVTSCLRPKDWCTQKSGSNECLPAAVVTSSEAKALLFERVSNPRLSMKRWLQDIFFWNKHTSANISHRCWIYGGLNVTKCPGWGSKISTDNNYTYVLLSSLAL